MTYSTSKQLKEINSTQSSPQVSCKTRTIRFGVERFVMLNRIPSCSPTSLVAETDFADAPAYLALEAMAQAGALHFRYCMDFSKHAFLLTVQEAPVLHAASFSGHATITANQTALTDSTAGYSVTFSCNGQTLSGELLFGSTPFDNKFSKDTLTSHYRELFQCLQNG